MSDPIYLDHFTRYAPEKIEYGVNRYQNETRRLYGVLDKHLSGNKYDYLTGEKCTIAGTSRHVPFSDPETYITYAALQIDPAGCHALAYTCRSSAT